MKKAFLLLLFSVMNVAAQDISQMRSYLQSAQNSESKAREMIAAAKSGYLHTKKPTYWGFEAVGNFYLAKNSANPFKKLSYFNQGRKKLDAAIAADSKNAELRLLRLVAQENSPSVLNYKDKIQSDRVFLKNNYQNIEDEQLKRYIKKQLKL